MAQKGGISYKADPQYDIVPVIAQFLDPHLVLPVLDSDFYKSLNVSAGGATALARTRPTPVHPRSASHRWRAINPPPHPVFRARRSTMRRSLHEHALS